MKHLLILMLLGVGNTLLGQACWTYTYDDMGNRIARIRSGDVFQPTIIDVAQSGYKDLGGSNRPMTDWSWVYPAYTTPGSAPLTGTQSGPLLVGSTATNRRIFNEYSTPRYWTVDIRVCDPVVAPNIRSIQYEMYRVDNNGNVLQSFNTIENNPAYLMFGNASQYTRLYTLNDPIYGFYSPTGAYDAGFPKGKYNWRIRAWDKPGVDYGPYPANVTKNVDPSAVLLLEENYYLDIISTGARIGTFENSTQEVFAIATPNPVTNTLTLTINGAKGQEVNLHLVDATGRLLMKKGIGPQTNQHHEEVDMTHQTMGVYFMQVSSHTQYTTLKVMKITSN